MQDSDAFMNRITRYIAGHLLIATLFVTLTITCAVWLTQSLRFIELIVKRALSIGSYLYLTLLLLPSFLAMLLPIGMFAAMVFTYNRLTADSELIVMRATGLGPVQLAKPAVVMTLLVVAMGYLLHLVFMPLSYREFKDLEMDFRTDYSAILLREGAFNTVSDGITVYIRAREANGELQGIIVHDNRNKERTVTIMAERGILAQAEEGPRVIMVNGNRQLIDRETGKLSLLYFDRYSVDIGRPGAVDEASGEVRWREPRERFITELLFPADTPNDQRYYDRLRAEGHNRLTAPLYALAFMMIALASLLSGDHNRRGQARRVIIAIGLAVAVQSGAVLVSGLAARSAALLPLIWLNVLTPIVIGAWWLFRVPRRRRPRELMPEGAA
jgi:lipopolysaccharide export system permease protein